MQDDIKARTNALTAVYSAIIKQDDKQIQNIPFFDTTSSLFINNSKKAILLKNALVDSIVQAIRNPKKSQITTISDILSQMKDLNV